MAMASYRTSTSYSASISLYWSFTSARWFNTDSLLRIKDLPSISIGEWRLSRSHGLDCNLNSAGKTCAGELDFSEHDEDLIEEDIFDELSPLQNQGAGEYVFESDLLADTNVARTSDAMALSFLCT
ncbi:hypothetical protein L211DRAFT_348627 [Terfezia boudieri ATCC MYA-4762]|uniref:Uncharacterized protein n=1 Tax=Terfezia boudieri ATCC MYA-4762 TaxID=1051890 RepID=A0A3N4LN31_9PEZI|nr:hypothetical protein L211DRAFT_348627 [Terfezia boudieri ATCC MYA-4762]